MREHTRRAVAFVAAALINGKATSALYDDECGEHFAFSGQVTPLDVSVCDHADGTHVTGQLPMLYHHGNKSPLSLVIEGGSFSGFDHHSGHHFSGCVSGSSIALFDHETQLDYLFATATVEL